LRLGADMHVDQTHNEYVNHYNAYIEPDHLKAALSEAASPHIS